MITFDAKAMSENDLNGGAILSHPSDPCAVGNLFTAEVFVRELPSRLAVAVGFEGVFHCHNASVEMRLSKIVRGLRGFKGKGKGKNVRALPPKSSAVIEFTTRQAIAAEEFEDFAKLGRFTIREKGQTVLIGKILDVDESEEN